MNTATAITEAIIQPIAASATADTNTVTVDPERLARFVASQRGTQFTPDGTLKFVQKATAPEDVLSHLKTLLEELTGTPSAAA